MATPIHHRPPVLIFSETASLVGSHGFVRAGLDGRELRSVHTRRSFSEALLADLNLPGSFAERLGRQREQLLQGVGVIQ